MSQKSTNHIIEIQTFDEGAFVGNDGLCGFPLNRSCKLAMVVRERGCLQVFSCWVRIHFWTTFVLYEITRRWYYSFHCWFCVSCRPSTSSFKNWASNPINMDSWAWAFRIGPLTWTIITLKTNFNYNCQNNNKTKLYVWVGLYFQYISI